MTADEFWTLIDSSRKGPAAGTDEQVDRLTDLLAALTPAEIEEFDRLLAERTVEAYRWDLWAVAYIINGGCSDDGFEYFRGRLVSRGRAFFEAVLARPEHAATGVAECEEAECEAILYAAPKAYERSTGREMPRTPVAFPHEPAGDPWEEDDLERLYPKLWKRFMD